MSNFIDIYIDERDKKYSAFCPICNSVLQDIEDTMSVYENDACIKCFVMFVEPNRLRHGANWVPSKDELDDWLKKSQKNFKVKYRFF